MWEHMKENKILVIGFIFCLILASYVSNKKEEEKKQAMLDAVEQDRIKAEQEAQNAEITDAAITQSMVLPCGDILRLNIA